MLFRSTKEREEAATSQGINASGGGCFGDEEPDDHCCCCSDDGDDADACSGGAGCDGDLDTSYDYDCDDDEKHTWRSGCCSVKGEVANCGCHGGNEDEITDHDASFGDADGTAFLGGDSYTTRTCHCGSDGADGQIGRAHV